MSRHCNPYTVVPLNHNQFIDFHEMMPQVLINLNLIKWQSVKWLQYTQVNDEIAVMQKNNYDDEFQIITEDSMKGMVVL